MVSQLPVAKTVHWSETVNNPLVTPTTLLVNVAPTCAGPLAEFHRLKVKS
jgi:hypothetical protein